MNYKKFLEKAKAAGIETAEINFFESTETNATVFHHALENYTISKQSAIGARGIYKGKLGFASTENLDNKAIDSLVENIKEAASFVEKEEEPIIFKGSKKYHKKNMYNAALEKVDNGEKIKKLFEIEDLAYKANKYVTDVEVSYAEEVESKLLANSYGLTLKSKSNYFYYVVEMICKKGDETKIAYELDIQNDFSKFDAKALVEKTSKKVLAKFDGISIPSKKYKCVLNPKVTATFLQQMVNTGFSAEEIQKQSSVLAGKLNQKVFSSKVTIEEKPLTPNVFFRYFDDEGVATENKRLVDKGVIKTYMYNLETAKKDGVESTGNGYGKQKIGVSSVNLTLKPGKKTEEELFAGIKEGIYITSVEGIHSGLNAQSGDFSLESEGFLIKDGKISSSLKLLTIGGNLYSLFNDITAIANNLETQTSSTSASSVLVKGLKVSSL